MKTVVGLEIHVELSTKSKIFCSCSTHFGNVQNSQCCPICIGMPGTLPSLNKKVVEYGVMAGLALNCSINKESKMDRKNYFYPDLVKGYQITQYKQPLCVDGFLEIGQSKKIRKIGIERIHIEEDTGKSIYNDKDETLLDYNRSGVPLIEIVTKPHLNSGEEAKQFLEDLRDILQYIKISDVKMEEGSLRCDVNINIVDENKNIASNITELKNLNSFRAVADAIQFEEKRHIELLKQGKNTYKETRRWNDGKKITEIMRLKSTEEGYRYFPEKDILPIILTDEQINKIKKRLPELPKDRRKRWINTFDLPKYDIDILLSSVELADFFEETLLHYNDPKKLSNWILTELLRNLNEKQVKIHNLKFTCKQLAQLLNLIDEGTISNSAGKKVFNKMFESGEDPKKIAEENKWIQIEDIEVIEEVLQNILLENSQSVIDYKSGKDRAFGYLVGQAMKTFKGRGNPKLINKVLRKLLED